MTPFSGNLDNFDVSETFESNIKIWDFSQVKPKILGIDAMGDYGIIKVESEVICET